MMLPGKLHGFRNGVLFFFRCLIRKVKLMKRKFVSQLQPGILKISRSAVFLKTRCMFAVFLTVFKNRTLTLRMIRTIQC